MPSEEAHARQARHNRDYLETFDLKTTPFLDWAVTVTFYTALHAIERYFARKGLHPP